MSSRSNLEIKSRLFLGLGLLGLVIALLLYLLLRILLPLFAIAFFGVVGFWLWKQYRHKQQLKQKQQARINAQFYQMLKQQQGRISVLDFAMRTQLDGAAAQDYLNVQAQAFSAFFDTTPQGDLVYIFNSAFFRSQGTDPWAQAEDHWNYVEQAIWQERAQAEKAHTAWTNAKQVRTMRQLSKSEQSAKAATDSRPQIAPQKNKTAATEKESDAKTITTHGSGSSGGFISMELTPAESNQGKNPTRLSEAGQKRGKKRSQQKAKKSTTKLSQQNEEQPSVVRSSAYGASAYRASDSVVTIDVTAVSG